MFKGFSHSVRGASHEAKDLVCQDSSSYKTSERYAVAVVADGHGSKKHFRSNIGSKFAVEATIETIDRFYEDPDEFEINFLKNHKRIIKNIEKQIISKWNQKIEAHLKENPVTAYEKKDFEQDEFDKISPEAYYGSTLIAAVAGKGFTFGIQIGDGSLVAIFDDGQAAMPMDYEESAPANITVSICNSNAASMFNSFYVENKKLIALFASTDGLYTSFSSEYDFCDYHVILTSQLVNLESFEDSIVKNLIKRAHYGTQDDISLSCIFDTEMASDNVALLNQRIAENKQRAIARKAKLL